MNNTTRIGKANIPIIGLGTWQLFGQECSDIVTRALEIGYRHLDTAAMYRNHQAIEKGIRRSLIERDDIFITSKVWTSDLGNKGTRHAIEKALKELKTDYLDLYLIHWPGFDSYKRLKSYEVMISEKSNGRIRHIGVSNFSISQILEIEKEFGELPEANQIFATPFDYEYDVIKFLKNKHISITAYSPLAKGRILKQPPLPSLAQKYDKEPAQIALRWFVEQGIIAIPKSSDPERLQANFQIFDFELEPADLDAIGRVNQ